MSPVAVFPSSKEDYEIEVNIKGKGFEKIYFFYFLLPNKNKYFFYLVNLFSKKVCYL